MAEDPFNIVKNELLKTLSKIRLYIERFNQINDDNEKSKIVNELQVLIRGVEWDLQDLEDTIKIAEKNPQKFNLTENELNERSKFIQNTKEQIKKTKDSINFNKYENDSNQSQNTQIKLPNIISSVVNGVGAGKAGVKYTKLNLDGDSNDEIDNFDRTNLNNNNKNDSYKQKQEQIFKEQDVHLDLIGSRVSNLKLISQTMNTELESQSKLLDEFGNEMEHTDTKMQTVMKKLTKVLHLSSDKHQWTAIGVLLGVILLLIILLNILPSRK